LLSKQDIAFFAVENTNKQNNNSSYKVVNQNPLGEGAIKSKSSLGLTHWQK
jgi:hypothetical protein